MSDAGGSSRSPATTEPIAAERLASMRETTTVAALAYYAAVCANPGAAIDALAALNPACAEELCEQLAERDETTPAAIRAKADLWRIDWLSRSSSHAPKAVA